MNQPKVQTEADDPKPSTPNPTDPRSLPGQTHGIPDGAGDAEPKGRPTSDRHETETAPAKEQPGPT